MFRGVGVLQQLAGGNYNWIGFDPRSVKDSGPNLTCFPGDPEAQRDYEIAKSLMLSIPLNELWQRNKAYGERCSAVNVETDARYIGTSAVVQDLKHFIELQATANGASATDAKLWYYGVSYGTTIGQTFAAMYPEMVERMILDGNMYGEGYYNGNAAIDSLTDADAAMRSFFLYCTDAGPSACSFARNGTDGHILTAPEELEQRYDGLLRKLEDVPLVISSTSLKYPNAVTRRGLQGFVLNQLETPAVGFPLLGKMLAELDLGVTATWVWFIDRRQGIRLPSPDVPYNLIQCVDVGRRWELGSTTDYLAYFEGLRNISRYGGETAGLELAPLCAGFSIYPPESQNFHGRLLSHCRP
jgi:pimeloyl-ACP methyl ester carboxylesterase